VAEEGGIIAAGVPVAEENPSDEEEEEGDDMGGWLCTEEGESALNAPILSYAARHLTSRMIPKLSTERIDSLDPLIRKEYAVDEREEAELDGMDDEVEDLGPRVPILEKLIRKKAAEKLARDLMSENITCEQHENIDAEKKFKKEECTFDLYPIPERKRPANTSDVPKKKSRKSDKPARRILPAVGPLP
jgi:hypothetical protein